MWKAHILIEGLGRVNLLIFYGVLKLPKTAAFSLFLRVSANLFLPPLAAFCY